MKKYLHIIEYTNYGLPIPEKLNNEHEFHYGNNLIRSSVRKSESKEKIKESFDSYYNDVKLDEKVIDLSNVIIYDNLDIKPNQELAYVYECPVCLNKTITSDKNLDYCPQCEQTKFPFDLIAIVNTEQMDDISINNSDTSTLVLIKDGKLVYKDLPKEEDK